MIRSTTPTHYFKLPFAYTANVSKVLIVYAQAGEIILSKTEADITVDPEDGNTILVNLTQVETNLFKPSIPVEIQIRILTLEAKAIASQIYKVPVDDVLNDEVL